MIVKVAGWYYIVNAALAFLSSLVTLFGGLSGSTLASVIFAGLFGAMGYGLLQREKWGRFMALGCSLLGWTLGGLMLIALVGYLLIALKLAGLLGLLFAGGVHGGAGLDCASDHPAAVDGRRGHQFQTVLAPVLAGRMRGVRRAADFRQDRGRLDRGVARTGVHQYLFHGRWAIHVRDSPPPASRATRIRKRAAPNSMNSIGSRRCANGKRCGQPHASRARPRLPRASKLHRPKKPMPPKSRNRESEEPAAAESPADAAPDAAPEATNNRR